MVVDPLILALLATLPALLTWLVARQSQPSEIGKREADTITILNNSMAQVVGQLGTLSTDNIDLRKQVALGEVKIARLEDRGARQDEKISEQTKEILDLRQQVKDYPQSVRDLEKTIADLREIIDGLQAEIKRLQTAALNDPLTATELSNQGVQP